MARRLQSTQNRKMLTVTTGTATEAQDLIARDALQWQRQRLIALLRGLDESTWTAETRCSEWNVHEVVRHLCDVTLKSTALLRGALPEDVGTTAVDPRTTPNVWLARSANERPRDTLTVFEDASAALLDEVQRHVGHAADVAWLYGSVPWSIAVLHVFWDAWVHERDIVLPLERPHESTTVEARAAAAYGLVMSCLPLLIARTQIDEAVLLTGDGGGTFRINVCDDGPNARELSPAGFRAIGHVTISVADLDIDGEDAVEPLHGTLVDVVDSLVGRGPALGEVLRGPRERVRPLEGFRAFLLRPAS
jgi:uncharacterized protein (TIGR03083 family)